MIKAGLFVGLVFFGGLVFALMMQKGVPPAAVYGVGMGLGGLYIALQEHFEE